jgi:hypothetical protein
LGKKTRKYANFFEGGSKEQKESSVCEEWLNTYGAINGYDLTTLKKVDDQWPDNEVNTINGQRCGIEVNELVDSNCIRLNEKGEDVYRLWNEPEILDAITNRLKAKNTKSHGGKYKKLIVLIHTDEFEITFGTYSSVIEKHTFNDLENIDEAYLVYSYNPYFKAYPISVLTIGA